MRPFLVKESALYNDHWFFSRLWKHRWKSCSILKPLTDVERDFSFSLILTWQDAEFIYILLEAGNEEKAWVVGQLGLSHSQNIG